MYGNIIDVTSDALIYSTNVDLALTGGVGMALRSTYGVEFEYALVKEFRKSQKEFADVGEIIVNSFPGAPWKRIFHTVATSEDYYTKPQTVTNILKQCFEGCRKDSTIKSITCSPLGAGFGDLKTIEFCRLVVDLIAENPLREDQKFMIVCVDPSQFKELVTGFEEFKEKFEVEPVVMGNG